MSENDFHNENCCSGKLNKAGLLTRALGKRSLNFWDYVALTADTFTGKIDTHGGYFYSKNAQSAENKPDAHVSKQLIYGLACLGFEPFLATLPTDEHFESELQVLSELCANHHIQVLLAPERYKRDVLGIAAEGDRNGY